MQKGMRIAALVAIQGLLLVACSGGDSGSTEGSGSDTPDVVTTAGSEDGIATAADSHVASGSDTIVVVGSEADTGADTGTSVGGDTAGSDTDTGLGVDTGSAVDTGVGDDTDTAVVASDTAVSGIEFFVATDGDDDNAGTFDAPFLTLARAQEAVRSHPERGKTPIFVTVKDGTYYLDAPLVLDSRDGGAAGAVVTYRAQHEGQAVLSGGRRLALAWQPHKGDIVKAQTPAGIAFDQLFIDGRRQRMARYPNYDPDVAIFNGYAADAFSPEKAAGWADPTGGFMHAAHAKLWGSYHYVITGKDADNNLVYEGGFQNNRPGDPHDTYRMVENIFEELDAPGEWYHDAATNTLYYYPEPGIDLDTALVEVPQLETIVALRGAQDHPVSFVRFDGFVFRHANRTFMKTDEPLLRSDWRVYRGGAIFVTGAEDVQFANCELDQLGGNGIFVSNYNRRVTITGCHIHDMGASGVLFVGDPDAVHNPLFRANRRQSIDDISMEPGPKTDNYPADSVVEDCLIHNIGVWEKQTAGVQISMSRGITVRYTSIYDCPRAGINISEGTFGGHVLEHLDVFDTVLETGDHGSFNSWGRDRYWNLQGATEEDMIDLSLLDCERTIIRNSRFRCDHGWDIDLDDGSSNYEIYNNVLLNGGLKLREGYHREVYNNIVINNGLHPHVWFSNSNDRVYHNIFMAAHQPRGAMPDGDWGEMVDYNTYLTEAQKNAYTEHNIDAHSNFGDPLFLDPLNGNYWVAADSPALEVGFVNFDTRDVGVQKASLRAIAKQPVFPQLKGAVMPDPAPQAMWNGALAEQLVGEAYSAYGVSAETGGVALLTVPEGSLAAVAGFQRYDVITGINGDNNVSTIEDLLNQTAAGEGEPLVVHYVRDQTLAELIMYNYVY